MNPDVTLAEFQHLYDDDQPARISNGDLRRFRSVATETARRLGSLQGWERDR
jgi:hypothetical protein